ncbi:MAG: amino acid permease [Candidatus Riflebacteria bacterium]|nr:amino acid permease [Candidatus Riflebacteria bacterium]
MTEKPLETGAHEPQLVRGLGLRSATAVVAGSVIGSGVFLVAADISNAVPSPGAAVLVWVVGGFISLVGGLAFAELGAMLPGSGGPYIYLREAFNQLLGFLYGWTTVLIVQPGSIAAVAIGFAQFAGYLLPLSPFYIKWLASTTIVAFTVINLLGLKKGAGVLDLLTVLKVLALVGIGAAGLWLPARHPVALVDWAGSTLPGFGVALIAAFWAYDGWNNISYVAGEVENPQRNVPLSLLSGIALVGLLYVMANLAYYRFVPVAAIAASRFPAADAARAMAGGWAVNVVIVSVLLSTLGCVNGLILSGARVTYAMAADRALPPELGRVEPTYRVPSTALIVQLVLALALVWTGRYDQLFTYVVSISFFFYGLSAVALIVLRYRRPELERPFRVPLYPWLPLAYAAFTAAFFVNAVIEKPVESLCGVGMVLLGIPVFLWQRARNARQATPPAPSSGPLQGAARSEPLPG